MVMERVRTLPTEPMEGEIAKSNSLLSFINIGQRGRSHCYYNVLAHAPVCHSEAHFGTARSARQILYFLFPQASSCNGYMVHQSEVESAVDLH